MLIEYKNLIKMFFKKPIWIFWQYKTLLFAIPYILLNRYTNLLTKKNRVNIPDLNGQVYGKEINLIFKTDLNLLKYPKRNVLLIPLAKTKINIKKKINWFEKFNDQEDTFALHRFFWLLDFLVKQYSRENCILALNLILDWIENNGENYYHRSWESYSVAERLVNWAAIIEIIISKVNINKSCLSKITNSFKFQLEYLLINIEDNNGRFTNNHVLNNARGLYIGGYFLSHEKSIKKARILFKYWIPKLITEDGLLKENSSHYQLLVTNRIEQVYHISLVNKDKLFAAFLLQWIISMNNCSNFFYVKDIIDKNFVRIPFLGDISPDIDPDLFLTDELNAVNYLDTRFYTKNGINNSFKNIGRTFYRYSDALWIIFWHIYKNPINSINHGHFVTGNFVLFYKGCPIIIDIGRCSYCSDNSLGTSAQDHNTVLVNGLGLISENRFFRKIPFVRNSNTTLEYNANTKTIVFFTNLFTRLGDLLLWERKFIIKDNSITILDTFNSANRNNKIQMNFNFDSGLKLSNIPKTNSFNVISNKHKLNFKFQICCISDKKDSCKYNVNLKEIASYPRYGLSVPATSVELTSPKIFKQYKSTLTII
jgi:hypothetical protein